MTLDAQGEPTFVSYQHNPQDSSSISSNSVRALLIDHQKNYWVGTNRGLNLFDPKTGKFQHFWHDPKDETSLGSDYIRCLYQDSQKNLWIGTRNSLDRYDYATGTFWFAVGCTVPCLYFAIRDGARRTIRHAGVPRQSLFCWHESLPDKTGEAGCTA